MRGSDPSLSSPHVESTVTVSLPLLYPLGEACQKILHLTAELCDERGHDHCDRDNAPGQGRHRLHIGRERHQDVLVRRAPSRLCHPPPCASAHRWHRRPVSPCRAPIPRPIFIVWHHGSLGLQTKCCGKQTSPELVLFVLLPGLTRGPPVDLPYGGALPLLDRRRGTAHLLRKTRGGKGAHLRM